MSRREKRKAAARVRRIEHARMMSCSGGHGRLDCVEVQDRMAPPGAGPPREGGYMLSQCRRCAGFVVTAWRQPADHDKRNIRRSERAA